MNVYASVESVGDPVFSPHKYDLSGKSFLQKGMFLLKNPPRVVLIEDFKFKMENGTTIVVPRGFVTDGASVPRWFWAIPGFSPYGVLLSGGIPHDMGYQYGFLLAERRDDVMYSSESIKYKLKYGHRIPENLIPVCIGYPQEFYDALLYSVCRAYNPSFTFIPEIAYIALRWQGHHAWNKYRREGVLAYGGVNSLNLPGV
jgi:hypothetical protein